MNENWGMKPEDARSKICPIIPPTVMFSTQEYGSGGNELARASSIFAQRRGDQYCRAEHCMMWVWMQGGTEKDCCGLRGHVVLP